ncbi:MAG: VCBS repeat-containing protein, partial [Candidatus Omnitrophica bacterium]|nr:VCBS repeat-containing protein [Candidatus Omnitrophota bacterium]
AKDAGDFNEDGCMDFLMAANPLTDVYFYEGQCNGSFKTEVDVGDTNAATDPYGLIVADFNMDGHLDFIVDDANIGAGDLWDFYTGAGDGTFALTTQDVIDDGNDRYNSGDNWDFDSDGDQDIVFDLYDAEIMRFYKSDGDGTFTYTSQLATGGTSTMGIGAPHPVYEFNLTLAFVEQPLTKTNSTGDYTYNITAPASIGVYPIKVNVSYNGYYAENSQTLTVYQIPVIESVTTNATAEYNKSFYLTANVTDENLVWVNFTVTDPDGINVVDNVNGTNAGTLWNSSTFTLNKSGIYNYTVVAMDADGYSDTETGQIDFLLISEELDPTTANVNSNVVVSGRVNFSNSTDVANTTVHIYLNGTEQFCLGVATGGTITTVGDYTVHTFTSNSTFNSTGSVDAEVLIVAGGGGGGMDMGGGGGGGGVVYNSSYVISAQNYNITVGAGGAGAPAAGTNGQPSAHQYTIGANNGQNSSFETLIAVGGGRGGSSYYAYTPGAAGANGGSGGGASGYSSGGTLSGGIGIPGQGNDGGRGGGQYYSGGGGGAGTSGTNSTAIAHGGDGVLYDLTGTAYYWGGGGGGSAHSLGNGGNGGLGGAGGGGVWSGTGGTAGTGGINAGEAGGNGVGTYVYTSTGGSAGVNTGSGGGGGAHYYNRGGDGGSGIVIVRYKTSELIIPCTTNSTGHYTDNLTTPATPGIYPVKVNVTKTINPTYYAENTKTLTVYQIPVINSVTLNATAQYNKPFHLTANVTDDNLVSVNFTVTDPDGTAVVNNVNGTNAGTLWDSSSFTLNKSGTYNYTVIAYDVDSYNDTETGSISFLIVGATASPSPVHINTSTTISGKINHTNGTVAANTTIQIFLNNSEKFDFEVGDGSDGSLTVTAANTQVNNYTYLTGNENSGEQTIVVNSATDFTVGDELLIIQIQNSSSGTAGTYEFVDINNISGASIGLTQTLTNSYTSGTFDSTSAVVTQVVRVPHYTSVTINSGASITASAWNGYSGGIVAFRVSGDLTNNGYINTTGKGFRQPPRQADNNHGVQGEGYTGKGGTITTAAKGNGGGGGQRYSDGGGGGGNGAVGLQGRTGQNGPATPGAAGAAIGSADLSTIFFGGAGGHGGDNDGNTVYNSGGHGGGIIFVAATNITGTGGIKSNGLDGSGGGSYGDGGVGGGAGGTVWLRARTIQSTQTITAKKGYGVVVGGAPSGTGGDGGVGRIRLDYDTFLGTSTPGSGYNATIEEINVSITTNSTGDYSYIMKVPATAATYPVKINLTALGLYGENTFDLIVAEIPQINSVDPGLIYANANITIITNITDNNVAAVNFTVIDPDGITIIDNINGTNYNTDLWNSTTFNLNKNGTYNYSFVAYDTDNYNSSYSNSFLILRITETLSPSTILAQDNITVSGKINYSDGTNLTNQEFSIYLNQTKLYYDAYLDKLVDYNPLFGRGTDGSLTVTATNTQINNYTYLMGNENSGETNIFVNDSTNFTAGDEILIIQMQDYVNDSAGTYEFATVSSVDGNNLTLVEELDNGYTSGTFNVASSIITQVVRVPQYSDVTINASTSISAPTWNGYTGGIVAFLVNGTLQIDDSWLEDNFTGATLNTSVWTGADAVQDENISITAAADWGSDYIFTANNFPRAEGLTFQGKYYGVSGTENTMVGFKDSTAGYSYTDMPHAFYFGNNNVYVYEDGSNRGDTSYNYNDDTWYDFKIVLKSAGADYYYKASSSADWIVVYRSTYSTESSLRPGATAHSGTRYLDDFDIYIPAINTKQLGFRGGAANSNRGQPGNQGESTYGKGSNKHYQNEVGGGGGGYGYYWSGGSGTGGGYGTVGSGGVYNSLSIPGQSYGSANLSKIFLGSGGGSGAVDGNEAGTAGAAGYGGGLIIVKAVTGIVAGRISAEGGPGTQATLTSAESGGGGGGSGGSIYLVGENLTISGTLDALGGPGGPASWNSAWASASSNGGLGGEGRIRLDYSTLTGGTSTIGIGYNGSVTAILPKSNGTGDYNFTFVSPTAGGTYPIKVNVTYNDYYAENSQDLNVTGSANNAPSTTQPTIIPGTAYTTSTLTANTTYTDADSDNGTVYFQWYVNNVNVYNQTNASIATGTTVITTLNSGNFSKNDQVNLSVYAHDGTDDSSTSWSTNTITILNSVPTQGTPILNATNSNNNTNQNLTAYNVSTTDGDNDNVKNIFNWYLNGTS